MKGLSWARIALICFLAFFTQCLTLQPAVAQGQSGSDEKRHITLDVVAVDSAGKPMSGLQQQDFTILDNDKPQRIASFAAVQAAAADPPAEIVLLIDLVNTSFSRVAYGREQIDKFLRQNNGQLAYPVTLILFSDTATDMQPQPSRDGNKLADLLASSNSSLRTIGRSAGFYGAEERLQKSFAALDRLITYEGGKRGRKLVIWISPGWPMLAGPDFQFSNKQQQGFFDWIAGFNNGLRTSRITLYAIDPIGSGEGGVLRTFYYQNFLKGVKKPGQAGPGNMALPVLATQSGGLVLNTSNDLFDELNSCVADASAYYTMSFDAAPSDHVNEYHALTVKVDKPGVKARTNAAYYAQP